MKKIAALAGLAALSGAAAAQMPDVSLKIDLTLAYQDQSPNHSRFRTFDAFGRPSTVGLLVNTEPGYRVFVAEKLERIPGKGDPDVVEQYYVEDPGTWRLGKQYLPFGSGLLMREPVLAVRSDNTVSVYDVPIIVAGCDGGGGRQRGVVIHAGDTIGVSVAVGRHFGIAATSLDLIRRPEDAPGPGQGFARVYGLDFSRRDQQFTFAGELVKLTGGETSQDIPDTVYDFNLRYDPTSLRGYLIGVTHSEAQHADYYRFQGFFRLTKNVTLEPVVRYRNQSFYDLGVSLRIRF